MVDRELTTKVSLAGLDILNTAGNYHYCVILTAITWSG